MWGTDWTRAVKLLTYEQGVEAFRVTDRLSDSDRAALMGGTLTADLQLVAGKSLIAGRAQAKQQRRRRDMAQDDRYDPARLERMERRLQALEDAEAIRNLKARYAALCDNQYDADGIAALFTEDATMGEPRPGPVRGA